VDEDEHPQLSQSSSSSSSSAFLGGLRCFAGAGAAIVGLAVYIFFGRQIIIIHKRGTKNS
jgi:hypothetical protein